MIERICPKCKVPMNGEKCIKPNCGCATEISSTIYWCNSCNIPVFEKICPICGNETVYISTDIRPVFPEERRVLSEPIALDGRTDGAYPSALEFRGAGRNADQGLGVHELRGA